MYRRTTTSQMKPMSAWQTLALIVKMSLLLLVEVEAQRQVRAS
jgi:hypothetical protein